jgi:hypothetical protein
MVSPIQEKSSEYGRTCGHGFPQPTGGTNTRRPRRGVRAPLIAQEEPECTLTW